MKISKRTWILGIFILCLALALAGNLIAKKMQNYLTELDGKVTEKQAELDQMKSAITENEMFVKMWKDISDFQNESPVDRQNKFNAYIQTVLKDSLIPPTYRMLYPPTSAPLEARPNFQILNFRLSFSTQLSELLDFIIRLDQTPQLLRLETMSIKARTKSTQFTKYTVETGFSWNDLTVDMMVSIPAAKPSTDASKQEVTE
jgi:hypothetical protein